MTRCKSIAEGGGHYKSAYRFHGLAAPEVHRVSLNGPYFDPFRSPALVSRKTFFFGDFGPHAQACGRPKMGDVVVISNSVS
jgi:hypothetical protein